MDADASCRLFQFGVVSLARHQHRHDPGRDSPHLGKERDAVHRLHTQVAEHDADTVLDTELVQSAVPVLRSEHTAVVAQLEA